MNLGAKRISRLLWLLVALPVVVLSGIMLDVSAATATDSPRIARHGYEWNFPQDHLAHPGYQTEWWYFTGILEGEQKQYGYQFTIFRQKLGQTVNHGSVWFSNQIYLGHFSWIDLEEQTHRSFQKISRKLPTVAEADTEMPGSIRVQSAKLDPGPDSWTLRVTHGDTALQLVLSPTKPPLFQGPGGYSKKGSEESQASQYYSFTRMQTAGTLDSGGETLALVGTSWFDQEFGSSQLSETQQGWDWISLRLSDGTDFMVYRLREADGTVTPESSITLRFPDGTVEYIPAEQWNMEPLNHWESPRTGARYPVSWRIKIPEYSINLQVKARFPEQEMVLPGAVTAPYWEGVIVAEGSIEQKSVKGEGFLEMTGYVETLSGLF